MKKMLGSWIGCLLVVVGPVLVSAIPLASEIDCINMINGDYAHPKEPCSQHYFSCVGGGAFVRSCPWDLRYDVISKSCLEAAFVEACGGIATPPQTTTTTVSPSRNGSVFDVDCWGKLDGLYPDGRQACSPFFVACVGGIAYPLDCPAGNLRFDKDTDSCLDPAFVGACGGTPTTVIPTEPTTTWPEIPMDCTSLPDGDYENPMQKCSEFFVTCVSGKSMTRRCPEGLRFDIETKECWEEAFVKACGGVPTTVTPPTTFPQGVTTVFGVDCSGRTDGFYRDGREGHACSQYFVGCVAGLAEPFECPPNTNTKFDPDTGLCLLPEHVQACGGIPTPPASTTTHAGPILPDISLDCTQMVDGDYENPKEKCSSFYITCVAGDDMIRWCSDSLRFDKDTGRCMESAFVASCGGIPTPIPEIVMLPPVETSALGVDCAALEDGFYSDKTQNGCSDHFVGCSGGIATIQRCPPDTNTRFDVENKVCVPPSEIKACTGA